MKLKILPHPKAPLFNDSDYQKVFTEIVSELQSSNRTSDETIRQAYRQAGFVNLWFFLKHICSYAGPFESLNDTLHVDMCNFRQSLVTPGTRAGLFIPRSHFKTTIVTEGGSAWEMLRNPDIRIRITNAIADFARGFKLTVKAIFDQNDMMRWLYGQEDLDGESYVPKNEVNWNASTMILPNRTKAFREHTIETGGTTGAAESHHFDVHIVDDPIGMAALDSARRSNALMFHTKNWFWANEDTLLVSPRKGRVIVVGTRYAIDDLYDEIINKAHRVEGHPLNGFPYDEQRDPREYPWRIYYRKAIEHEEPIFPENFTLGDYERMAREKWWEYVTQYMNDPQEAGLTEMHDYDPRKFDMDFDGNEWFIEVDMVLSDGSHETERIPLSDCDVIMAIDPAATEKYVSARTSKTAVGLLATYHDGRKFLFYLVADYLKPSQMFEEIFKAGEKFANYLRNTYLEANAGFKVLGPIISDEQRARGLYLGLKPFSAVGEKDGRIRSNVQPELEASSLFVHKKYYQALITELSSFPQSHQKDVLDMLSMAIANARKPFSPEDIAKTDLSDEWFKNRRVTATGY